MTIKVLIVDPDISFVVPIKRALELSGDYDVRVFASGQAAIEHIQRDSQDVIIIDFAIDDMTLPELIAGLRRFQPGVFILTSPRTAVDIAQLSGLDAQGSITKPYLARQLTPVIHEALAARAKMEAKLGDLTSDNDVLDQPPPPSMLQPTMQPSKIEEPALQPDDTFFRLVSNKYGKTEEQELPQVPLSATTPQPATLPDESGLTIEEPDIPEGATIGELISGQKTPPHQQAVSAFVIDEPPTDPKDSTKPQTVLAAVSDDTIPMEYLTSPQFIAQIEQEDDTPVHKRLEISEPPITREDTQSSQRVQAVIESQEESQAKPELPSLVAEKFGGPPPPNDDAGVLVYAAQLLEHEGKGPEAATKYVAAADVYLSRRELDEAIVYWQRAAGLTPNSLQVHLRLAQAFERLGQTQGAVFEYLTIASNFYRTGDTHRALTAVDRAMRLDPGNVKAIELRTAFGAGDALPEILERPEIPVASTLVPAEETAPTIVEPVVTTEPQVEATPVRVEPTADEVEGPVEIINPPEVETFSVSEEPLARLAAQLTQLTVGSAAEATVVTRGQELVAAAGQFAPHTVAALVEIINEAWKGNNEQGSTIVRFIHLPDAGDYLLYSTPTTEGLALSMLFPADTPLKQIRKQARDLVTALESVPESSEPEQGSEAPAAVTMLSRPTGLRPPEGLRETLDAQSSTLTESTPESAEPPAPPRAEGPLVGYSFVWVPRLNSLDPELSGVLLDWINAIATQHGWQIDGVEIQPTFVNVQVSIPANETPTTTVETLMQETGAKAEDYALWSDAYYIVTSGRSVTQQEIANFIEYQHQAQNIT